MYWSKVGDEKSLEKIIPKVTQPEVRSLGKSDIYLAVVACGDRVQETLNMIKSALMFTKAELNIIVFTEDGLIQNFMEKVGIFYSL